MSKINLIQADPNEFAIKIKDAIICDFETIIDKKFKTPPVGEKEFLSRK